MRWKFRKAYYFVLVKYTCQKEVQFPSTESYNQLFHILQS